MGDRANVALLQRTRRDEAEFVVLYTHWGGSELLGTVQAAIKREARWDDEAYLARIILNEMQGDDRGETGFGISTALCDNEHAIIVIDPGKQQIGLASEDAFKNALLKRKMPDLFKSWTLEEFSGLKEDALERAWNVSSSGVARE